MVIENIFEGAQFGDMFQTRNGCSAVYLRNSKVGSDMYATLYINDSPGGVQDFLATGAKLYGRSEDPHDIVRRYPLPDITEYRVIERAVELYRQDMMQCANLLNLVRSKAGELIDIESSVRMFKTALTRR